MRRGVARNDVLAVLEYRVSRSELGRLDHLKFEGPTLEWADFVRFHRQYEPQGLFHGGKPYDAVSGPMWRKLEPEPFGSNNQTVENWQWPSDSQLSTHTEEAVDLFNRSLQPEP